MNILLLLGSTLLLVNCQTTTIPNVKFYVEIPFQDCPEGAYVESLTKKTGIVSCEEWKKKRPFMLMIDPDGKKEIFNQWAEACRWTEYENGNCNVKLQSVKSTIERLDNIARDLVPGD